MAKKQPTATLKKKTNHLFYAVLFLFADLYLSFLLAASITKKESFLATIEDLTFCYNPFQWDFSKIGENSKIFWYAFAIIGICLFLFYLYLISAHELMTGAEYGVQEWGDIDKINARYASKNENENRIYSENLRISLDTKKTRLNNNAMFIGGSGAGKSLFGLTPNLYEASADNFYPGSFAVTDPDGGLLRKHGKLLAERGMDIRVLNLISGQMHESDGINIMRFLRRPADVSKLVNAFFDNTKKEGEQDKDKFFSDMAKVLLESLVFYVWLEHDRYHIPNTFASVIELANKLEVGSNGSSELDQMMGRLVTDTWKEKKGGMRHPAYKRYKKALTGAEETVGSIIQTLHSRITIFDNDDILRILSEDDIDLSVIGTTKPTALFLVIPDSDTTYNAVAGMVYTMLMQELYYQADTVYGGELPIPFTFYFDEYANILLPENFPKILATMRKRRMSAVIFLQSKAQLVKLHKEAGADEIIDNCDTFVFMGGNSYSTFEYVSKRIGKKTIWKRSRGISRGSHSSSSQNDDVLGRELMLPDEVGMLDNDYQIVLIRGQHPVIDRKFDTLHHPDFIREERLGAYVHSIEKKKEKDKLKIEVIDNNHVDILLSPDKELIATHPALAELQAIVIKNRETEARERKINIAGLSLIELLSRKDFILTPEELAEVTAGIEDGLSDEEIKSYILYGDAYRMKQQRMVLKAIRLRSQQAGG